MCTHFQGFTFFTGFIESKSDLKWIKGDIFRSDDSRHFDPMYLTPLPKYYSVKSTPIHQFKYTSNFVRHITFERFYTDTAKLWIHGLSPILCRFIHRMYVYIYIRCVLRCMDMDELPSNMIFLWTHIYPDENFIYWGERICKKCYYYYNILHLSLYNNLYYSHYIGKFTSFVRSYLYYFCEM